MTGFSPGRPAPVRSGRAGYIDHRTTVAIVLIIAAVVGARFWPLLPGPWSRFLMVTAVLAVVGTLAVVAVGVRSEGRSFRPERREGRTVVRIPGAVVPASGVLLTVLGLDFLFHAWIGDGLLWWAVGALGVAAAGLGAVLAGWREHLVVEPGRVARETALFGRTTHASEVRWTSSEVPVVEVVSHTTGGAFGQPLTEVHRLKVDGETVLEGRHARLEELREIVGEALSVAGSERAGVAGAEARGVERPETRADREAILLRLDAEPPWPEGWKTRPPGWDDPDGAGVCAALCRGSGFEGVTIFELETGEVKWTREPGGARDLDRPLGSELFERLEPLEEDEVRALGHRGVREIADAFLRSRGFGP